MSGAVIGIALAVVVDLVLPLAIAAALIVRNRRRRTSDRSERIFWSICGVLAVPFGVALWRGLVDVHSYEGWGVVAVTIAALPASIIPVAVHVNAMAGLFTDAEWASAGYLSVLTIYVVGMATWALVNVTAARALASGVRQGLRDDRPRVDARAGGRPSQVGLG